jgi:hypothetical protein
VPYLQVSVGILHAVAVVWWLGWGWEVKLTFLLWLVVSDGFCLGWFISSHGLLSSRRLEWTSSEHGARQVPRKQSKKLIGWNFHMMFY